jgi:hypothetical protein
MPAMPTTVNVCQLAKQQQAWCEDWTNALFARNVAAQLAGTQQPQVRCQACVELQGNPSQLQLLQIL